MNEHFCRSLAPVALLALGCGAPALAQTVGASPDSGASVLQQVTVTAERREENLQSVPETIDVATGRALADMGVNTTSALSMIAPSLILNQSNGGGASITLRGVTSSGSLGDESATSIYVDGVYMAGLPGLYFDLSDVDHVEVLKGPQGTLFGRNSAGGAIQIITKTPQQTPHLDASVGYGNYSTVQGQVYGTTGLTEHSAIDLSLYGQNQGDGWGRNLYNGQDAFTGWQYAGRSKLLWKDGPNSVMLEGSYSQVKWPPLQGNVLLPGQLNAAGVPNGGFYGYDGNFPDSYLTTQATASLTASHAFSFAKLTNILGWEDTRLKGLLDFDYSRLNPSSVANFRASTRKFTEELQLAALADAPVQWIGGLYYFDATQERSQFTTGPLVAPATYQNVTATEPIKSYAGYGQATAEILPRLKLTLGARYTVDEHTIDGASTSSLKPVVPAAIGTIKDNAFTYRTTLAYQIDPQAMVYATASSGFKSGLFSLSVPTAPAAHPAELYAYEIGAKTELAKHLRLNASVFYDDYEHIQSKAYVEFNGILSSQTVNAAAAYAKGADLDAEYEVDKSLSFHAGVAYLDSRYGAFPNAQCFFPSYNAQGLITSYSTHSCSATHHDTEQSPTWVYTLSGDYRHETPVGDVFLNLTTNYNSGYYLDPQNVVPVAAYQLWNASLTWRPKGAPWTVKLWADNIGDARYWTAVYQYKLGYVGNPSAPRTYGVLLDYSF